MINMPNKIEWFFVSTLSGKIETDDQGSPLHYKSRADAEDAIKIGEHGDFGTRYVIRAELETVSVATRTWTLTINEPAPADPFADSRQFNAEPHDPPSPTGPGV